MWTYAWGSRHRRGLRVWVLQLLERGPMNGAEIMEQMDRMTMGWWRPSPGSIYPLLDQLVDEKLVRKRDDGRYEVTDSARRGPEWTREWFGRGPRTPLDAVSEVESYITYLEDVGRGGKGELGDLGGRIRAAAKRLENLADRPAGGGR